jgi:excisionase family DNA binding protein
MRTSRVGKLYTAEAVAKELGISLHTVYRRIAAGELETLRVGRSYLMTLEDAQRACRRRYIRRAG